MELGLDRISIYYGGADTVVSLAHGYLSDVLDACVPDGASTGAAAR